MIWIIWFTAREIWPFLVSCYFVYWFIQCLSVNVKKFFGTRTNYKMKDWLNGGNCEYKTFNKHSSIRQTKNVHEKRRDFKCGAGSKKINHKDDFKSVHDHNNDCECKKCGKRFMHISSFKDNINACQEEKTDLECEICNHKFSKKSNLLRHNKTVHQDTQKFTCMECDRNFGTFLVEGSREI